MPARRTLGLEGLVVCHMRHDSMLGFVAISRRVSPGGPTGYAWDRPIQWAGYLVDTKDIQIALHEWPPGTNAPFYSDYTTLNGPVPGGSYAGA